jgi:hypothetical protein
VTKVVGVFVRFFVHFTGWYIGGLKLLNELGTAERYSVGDGYIPHAGRCCQASTLAQFSKWAANDRAV